MFPEEENERERREDAGAEAATDTDTEIGTWGREWGGMFWRVCGGGGFRE